MSRALDICVFAGIPAFVTFAGYTSQLPIMTLGGAIATAGTLLHVAVGTPTTERACLPIILVGFAFVIAQIVGGHRIPDYERTLIRIAPFLNCEPVNKCAGDTRIIGGHPLEELDP